MLHILRYRHSYCASGSSIRQQWSSGAYCYAHAVMSRRIAVDIQIWCFFTVTPLKLLSGNKLKWETCTHSAVSHFNPIFRTFTSPQSEMHLCRLIHPPEYFKCENTFACVHWTLSGDPSVTRALCRCWNPTGCVTGHTTEVQRSLEPKSARLMLVRRCAPKPIVVILRSSFIAALSLLVNSGPLSVVRASGTP